MGIPVPQQVLSKAIKENLDNIRNSSGLDTLYLDEETSKNDEPIENGKPIKDGNPIDWPLVLGLSLAGALFLMMGIAIGCM
jgi:hypothetical protein